MEKERGIKITNTDETKQCTIPGVSIRTDFKTLLKTNIIPRVELMEEKENIYIG